MKATAHSADPCPLFFSVPPEKISGMHERDFLKSGGEIILQAAREMQRGIGGNILDAFEQFLRAGPADFDAAEQIRFRARHAEQARGIPFRIFAENLRDPA